MARFWRSLTVVVLTLLVGHRGPTVTATVHAMTTANPCATLRASATPTTVPPGGTVTVRGAVTNCSSQPETLTLRGHLSGPCHVSYTLVHQVTLRAGETLSGSRTYTVPSDACAGTYTVRVAALEGTTVLARTSFTVTVT